MLRAVRKDSYWYICTLILLYFFYQLFLSSCTSDMVAHSGRLVSAAEDALLAAANKARDSFNDALSRLYSTYKTVSVLVVCIDSKSYLPFL
jgi:hypothetical protein